MNVNTRFLRAALALAIAAVLPLAATAAAAATGSSVTTPYEFRWPIAGLQPAPAPCVKHSVTYSGTVVSDQAYEQGDGQSTIVVPASVVGSCTQVEVVAAGAGSATPPGGSATPSDMATATFAVPPSQAILAVVGNAIADTAWCPRGACLEGEPSMAEVGSESVVAIGADILNAGSTYSVPPIVACAAGAPSDCVYDQFGGVTGTTPGYVTLTFLP